MLVVRPSIVISQMLLVSDGLSTVNSHHSILFACVSSTMCRLSEICANFNCLSSKTNFYNKIRCQHWVPAWYAAIDPVAERLRHWQ